MIRFGTPVLIAAVLAMCLSCALPATAQNVVMLNSVAAAGKQRMLSQRALKAYAQLSLNVAPEKAAPILAASMEELKNSNVRLRAMAKEATLDALQAQAVLIDKLAAAVAMPPSSSSVHQAAQVSEELLNNAEAVTQNFMKSGSEAPAAMVNLAARQRMLSQRAASAYFVYHAVIRSPDLKARALKAAADFKTAITAFDDARSEFPQIAERIEMARVQMIFFDNALSNIDSPTREQFATIATVSERVLSEMDAMTTEMVKQIAQRSVVPPTAAAKKK